MIVTNKHIHDWYRKASYLVIDEISKHLLKSGEKIAPNEANEIFFFMWRGDWADAAKASMDFLEDNEKRYNSGELRKLVHKLNIHDIRKIRLLIGGGDRYETKDYKRGFIDGVCAEQGIFTLDTITNGYGNKETVNRLQM